MTPQQQDAVAYLTRTGNADLLPILGLAPSPPPARRRPPPLPESRDRSHHRCMCARTGRPYRLCPVHGANEFRDEEFRDKEG